MKRASEAEYDALADHADAVSRDAWRKLSDHDATAALIVIGTLIASVQSELGWTRERIIEEVCDIADDCDQLMQ